MRDAIKEQIKVAVTNSIESMEPYKSQTERYNALVKYIDELATIACNKLDAMDDVSLKVYGIKDAKGYINYFARTDEVSLYGNAGKQLMALIAKNI